MPQRQDRATKLLTYISDVIVNGHALIPEKPTGVPTSPAPVPASAGPDEISQRLSQGAASGGIENYPRSLLIDAARFLALAAEVDS